MKTRFLSMTTFAVLVLASTVACADVSRDTKDFVRDVIIGSKFEIESSQLALDRSTDPSVRAFARMMVEDHGKTMEKLDKTLVAANIDPAIKPVAIDADHVDVLEKLRQEDVRDFDREYAKVQKKTHDDSVELFQDYTEDGDNLKLKAFAGSVLPMLRRHAEEAKKLEGKKD